MTSSRDLSWLLSPYIQPRGSHWQSAPALPAPLSRCIPTVAEGSTNPARLDLSSSRPIWILLNQPHKVERVSSPHAIMCKEEEEVKQLF